MTTRSVLIADDHVEMARLLADKLREDGWRPRVVDSGKAAVESLSSSIPDLVITDLRMAEVDGLDVLDAVRAIDLDLPVIIMTAFGAIETAIEAMKRGAWHYVVKPARLNELALHANRAFEHRTLRKVRGAEWGARGLVGDGAVGLCAILAAKEMGAERIIAAPRAPPTPSGDVDDTPSGEETLAQAGSGSRS